MRQLHYQMVSETYNELSGFTGQVLPLLIQVWTRYAAWG